MAKAMLSLKGASLSLSEHGDLISTIKAETQKIHAEMLESMELLPKSRSYTCHLLFLTIELTSFFLQPSAPPIPNKK